MNTIKELKVRNEMLSRELAEAVRDHVEYSFAYRDLRKKTNVLRHIFANFLVSEGYEASSQLADLRINKMIDATPSDQLDGE